MNILYLIVIILGISGQNILKKPYTDKNGGKSAYTFCAMVSIVAMLFFVLTSGSLCFSVSLLPYSLGFAAAYSIATVFAVISVSCGLLSLTSLIISYSLMIPAFYGIIFLGDSFDALFIIGMILLVISLLLINNVSVGNKISFKWLISVFLAFAGNGMCSVVQKMQQLRFDGKYKNEFMIIALAAVTVITLPMIFVSERKNALVYIKIGWRFAVPCGILNGVVNLFVMLISEKMPVSVIFPLISAGGIAVTYIISKYFYKEKLTIIQTAGFIAGIISIVFLNL